MRGLSIAIVLGFLGGCRDNAVQQLQDIRDEVCACKDVACGEAAMKKVPQPAERVQPNPKSQQLAREMIDCMAKLYLADRPETDPDAEAPEADTSGSATSPGSADPASARTP